MENNININNIQPKETHLSRYELLDKMAPSHAAMMAAITGELSSAAGDVTAPQAANGPSDPTPMTQVQSDTYWWTRAFYDMSSLYTSQEALRFDQSQVYINDLKNVVQSNINSGSATMDALQEMVNEAINDPNDFFAKWDPAGGKGWDSQCLQTIENFRQSPGDLDMTSGDGMTPDSMMYLSLGLINLLSTTDGSIVGDSFLFDNGKPTSLSIHFSQLISSVLIQHNLNADGSVNLANMKSELGAIYKNLNVLCQLINPSRDPSKPLDPGSGYPGLQAALLGSAVTGSYGLLLPWKGFQDDYNAFNAEGNFSYPSWWFATRGSGEPVYYNLASDPVCGSNTLPDIPGVATTAPSGTLNLPDQWDGFSYWLSYSWGS